MFGRTRVHYEVSADGQAMSYGGIAAVHRLVTKLGLVKEIDARLHLLKAHLPYHESDHVLNLSYNIMCGGTRLEDIERLRSDVAYMNALDADLIPDPTTAGDFTRRFTQADVIELMDCINAVRFQVVAHTRCQRVVGGGIHRRGWHQRPDVWTEESRNGHLLQGRVGICAVDRVVGQHQRGAVRGQPSGQRVFSPGRRTLDRCGHKAGEAPRRTRMPARRHGFFAHRPLRWLGQGCRFHLRHGLQ